MHDQQMSNGKSDIFFINSNRKKLQPRKGAGGNEKLVIIMQLFCKLQPSEHWTPPLPGLRLDMQNINTVTHIRSLNINTSHYVASHMRVDSLH